MKSQPPIMAEDIQKSIEGLHIAVNALQSKKKNNSICNAYEFILKALVILDKQKRIV